jgi:hypothetical protein
MGQQQLLLLVLATVIVGLATVAGIQAFDENQAQASQDALVQRATSIASDIKGLDGKPDQLGGISVSSASASDIREKLGLQANPFDVPSAGDGAQCEIKTPDGSINVECAAPDAPENIQVVYSPTTDGSDEVTTNFGSGSVGSGSDGPE